MPGACAKVVSDIPIALVVSMSHKIIKACRSSVPNARLPAKGYYQPWPSHKHG